MSTEEETIQAAVDAAIADGVMERQLRKGAIKMCRTGFAQLREMGYDTSDFIVTIDHDRPDGELQFRVRPPLDRPMTGALVEGGRTRQQLLGTYQATGHCPDGECVCQFKGESFPLVLVCTDLGCPLGVQVMPTFEDMPYWARFHRKSGCTSKSVRFIPAKEVRRP